MSAAAHPGFPESADGSGLDPDAFLTVTRDGVAPDALLVVSLDGRWADPVGMLAAGGVPTIAVRAAEAIGTLRRRRPGAALLDGRLPAFLELAAVMKATNPDLPVLVVGRAGSTQLPIGALGHVDDYLVPPLEQARLLSTVRSAIEGHRLRRQNAELLDRLQQVNARLEDTLGARTAELGALVDFAESVAEAEGLGTTIQAVLGSVARQTGSRHLAVYLADDTDPTLRLSGQLGQGWRLPPVIAAPAEPVTRTLFGVPPRSVTMVPISTGRRTTGALLIGHYTHGNPAFLRTIASFFRVAVANARRFERERETVERLSELSRLKSGFLASVSHELRTPLTAVLGFARTLQSRELTADLSRDLLGRIVDQGQRLQHLVDDLLDATRIESGRIRVKLRPVELATLFARLEHSFPDVPNEITTSLHPDLPPVLADEHRLEQVLVNLVHNATKYSPAHAPIDVHAARADLDGWVRISVRDRGGGIDPAFLPRLFDPFTQADTGDTRRDSGVGLGLSIARGLVQVMGGEIAVDSEPGVGTTFEVMLRTAGTADADEGSSGG